LKYIYRNIIFIEINEYLYVFIACKYNKKLKLVIEEHEIIFYFPNKKYIV